MAVPSEKTWRLARNGEEFGPYTSQELAKLGQEGRITSDMVVWREGMEDWQPVARVKGLRVTPVAPMPPPAPTTPSITVAVAPSPTATPIRVKGHVTVEKTGKALKLQQLLGLLCIVAGLAMLGIAMGAKDARGGSELGPLAGVGSLLLVVGIFWRIVTRVRIWWHHG